MNNNKFIRDKKKFNPDVLLKMQTKENERSNMKVEMKNNIYNPITNIIPEKITKQSDLMLNFDNNKVDIRKQLLAKELERNNQDTQYKPVQTKMINENLTNININNFIELKQSNKNTNTNNKKYNSVLDNLKDLGILQ
jgi:hypothetical protein